MRLGAAGWEFACPFAAYLLYVGGKSTAGAHAGTCSSPPWAPRSCRTPEVFAKVEEQTADGTRRRIDISYGRLIIEVKNSLEPAKLVSLAKKQLGDYLRTLRDRDGSG
jgi:hypothetical protein